MNGGYFIDEPAWQRERERQRERQSDGEKDKDGQTDREKPLAGKIRVIWK